MFDAADEAGGTLTAEIYDEHWYDGVPTKAQAQKRYRARCAAAAAAEAAADDEAAAAPAKRRKPVPPAAARTGASRWQPRSKPPSRPPRHMRRALRRPVPRARPRAGCPLTSRGPRPRSGSCSSNSCSCSMERWGRKRAALSRRGHCCMGAPVQLRGWWGAACGTKYSVRLYFMCCEYDYRFVHCNAKSVYECIQS